MKKVRRAVKTGVRKATPGPDVCLSLLEDLAADKCAPLAVTIKGPRGAVRATISGHPDLIGTGTSPAASRSDLAAKVAATWPLYRRLEAALSARAHLAKETPSAKWIEQAAQLVFQGETKNRAAEVVMAEIAALPENDRPKLTHSTLRRYLTKI